MVDESLSRRRVVKSLGVAAGTGALGSLAGCSDNTKQNSDESKQKSSDGSQSAVTVDFWSFVAAENQSVQKYFKSSMKNFESKNPNIKVKLQAITGGQMREKLPSVVSAGNAPDLAEGGVTPLKVRDQLADHGSYLEGTDITKDYTQANLDSMKYRNEYWAGGGNRHLVSMLAVRPKFFKEVGVDDPSGLETWTDYRRALDKIKQKHSDVYAYEATGSYNDLESYWGEARTAYTGGTDPFFESEAWKNPKEKIKIDGSKRTDGMIKNIIDNANTYSSQKAGSRTDEEMASLLLTDRAASFTYGLGNAVRYKQVKSDVTFGWDGDIWQGPMPKLDPNYGDEFGIEELAGKKGEHGGHLWSLQMQKQAFNQDHNHPKQAFKLMTYVNTSEDHNLKLLTEKYPAISSYKPLNKKIKKQYADKLPQIQKVMYELPKNYGAQYNSTGATWDLDNTSKIRWNDINQTISETIAGQHSASETPGLIKKRISNHV